MVSRLLKFYKRKLTGDVYFASAYDESKTGILLMSVTVRQGPYIDSQ